VAQGCYVELLSFRDLSVPLSVPDFAGVCARISFSGKIKEA